MKASSPTYTPPLAHSYVPSTDPLDCVPADAVRRHVLDMIDAGLDRRHIADLTGVSPREISALISFDQLGRPLRPVVDARVASALFLVRRDLTGAAPDTRILAVGAQRRIQALARMGHSLATIAGWLHLDEPVLDKLLDPTTRVVSVRAHRAIAAVFRAQWMTVPAVKDHTTIARAEAAGWQPALVWDDIDFDLAPAARTLRAVDRTETVDEIAIDLALNGTHVHLTATERRIVIARAHALHLGDNAISALTGIPLTTTWNIRTELGLASWADEYEAVELAAIA